MAKRTTTTLIYYFSLLTLLSFLLTTVEAKSHHHARMIKVRQTNGNGANNAPATFNPFAIENIGNEPTNTPPTDTKTAKGGKQTDTATGAGAGAGGAANNTAAQGTDTAAGQGTPTDGGLLGGVTSLIDGLNPTGTPTNTSTTPTATATQTNTTSSSTTPTNTPTPPAQSTSIVFNSVTVTSTSPSTETTNAQANVNDAGQNTSNNNNNSHLARNTIIVIAAIGGSVVLAVIIWTIFRKMKLGPSEGFEERLNPIDWNPTNNNGGNPDMVQARRASVGSNRSFSSADVHSIRTHITNNGGSGAPGAGYHANGGFLVDIPNHDFTAGPQLPHSLAPGGGGGGGYADLRRGPSRGPYDTRGGGAYGGY